MEKSIGKSLLILGRQPELGLAELESLYGTDRLQPVSENVAILDIVPDAVDFGRLGGSLKLANVLDYLPASWPKLETWLATQIAKDIPAGGKFTVGVSIYGLDQKPDQINRSLLGIKKTVRNSTGKAIRIVPNQSPALSSAQVLHNKLTAQNGREYVIARSGTQVIIAQTLAEQDIEAYAARDQARPKRDATVGMLPPKLAQIILNLATGDPQKILEKTGSMPHIMDPFCGTGVILQEALLMGYLANGYDRDSRMVNYAKENIEWLHRQIGYSGVLLELNTGDATSVEWLTAPLSDAVASETYLGRALTKLPPTDEYMQIVHDVDTILSKFLKNIASQLKPGAPLSLAVPAWRSGNSFIELPLIEHLTDMGYTIREFRHAPGSLIYWREGQVVGRRLLVINKK